MQSNAFRMVPADQKAICLILLILVSIVKSKDLLKDESKKLDNEAKKTAKLPPCAACNALVSSFEAGMKKTSREKLAGGDTAWEERNQKNGYANSEVRFVEIQEKLCADVERGETQCHDNHHHWEEHIEGWWKLGHESSRASLKDWLCIEKLGVCCHDGFYGPDCKPCQVIAEDKVICSGNGKCKGSGTRKGNGKCACDVGYTSENCTECVQGYFNSYADEEKKLCSKCHASCDGPCTGAGPKSCLACQKGYAMDTETGCQDVDECVSGAEVHQCDPDTKFCVNTEGSHRCMKCDISCKGCFADGPDSCTDCANGYVFQKNKDMEEEGHGSTGICITEKEAGRQFSLTNTRYVTYGGLVVAAAIISQRSFIMAGTLGLVIVFYVALSEYYLQGATGELKPVGV